MSAWTEAASPHPDVMLVGIADGCDGWQTMNKGDVRLRVWACKRSTAMQTRRADERRTRLRHEIHSKQRRNAPRPIQTACKSS
eukprot:363597-Chlamydomonas_euryale.AAC.11